MQALLIGGAVLALACGLGGYRLGADTTQARWDRQRAADQQAAEVQRESYRLRAQAAATNYEARRASIARRATQASPEARNALNEPVCRPLGASAPAVRLGDLPVPAAVLQRLRDAGADPAPD